MKVRILFVLPAAACALFLGPVWAEDHARFGQPACPGQILDKTYYVVCYSPENKIPVWVEYALTRQDLAGAGAKRTNDYRADPELPKEQRALPADYAKSGFDMGHMAPAEDLARSKKAMSASFLLSNMVPQKPRLNEQRWKDLEGAVRKLVQARGSAWIVSGPIWAGNKPIKRIGRRQVAVPSHCFKVILSVQADGTKEMFAAVMPNTNATKADLAHYAQTVRFVENLSGLNFFSALPTDEQDRLEGATHTLPAQ